MIILFCGPPGTGKTTLASELAPMINAAVLSTDKIRKELIPRPTYAPEEKGLVYNVMFLVAKYLHSAGINCILDGTFNTEKSRKQAMDNINSKPDQFYIVECLCPEDVVIARLQSRKEGFSDAGVSVYREMKEIYEPPREARITADTSRGSPEMIAREVKSKILQKAEN